MDWQTIASLGSLIVVLITVSIYFNGKITEAVEKGKLIQRVETLEMQQDKSEASKEDIKNILVAIGKLSEKIESIQKDVDGLKDDIKCIERGNR